MNLYFKILQKMSGLYDFTAQVYQMFRNEKSKSMWILSNGKQWVRFLTHFYEVGWEMPCSRTGSFNIVEIQIVHKLIFRYDSDSNKNCYSWIFFFLVETDQLIPNFMEVKRTLVFKNFKQRITKLEDFQLTEATVIKTVWLCLSINI